MGNSLQKRLRGDGMENLPIKPNAKHPTWKKIKEDWEKSEKNMPSDASDYTGEKKKKLDTSEMIKMKKGGASKNWIKDAIKKPGALKKSLGVKAGKTIPAKKLAAAAKKPGKMGQRARLAQTLGKMKRG